jgi:hypothetical protein
MNAAAAIRQLLADATMGVLATAGPEGPLTSLMAFAVEGPSRLVMATLPDTRKWRNMLADPRISLLIDDRETALDRGSVRALTLAGRHEPGTQAQRQAGFEALGRRHPHLAGLLARPEIALIRLQVTSYLLLAGPTEAVYLTNLDEPPGTTAAGQDSDAIPPAPRR